MPVAALALSAEGGPPPNPRAFLFDLCVQASTELAGWLELGRELERGVPWEALRHRVDLLLSTRASALRRSAYDVPR